MDFFQTFYFPYKIFYTKIDYKKILGYKNEVQ